MSAAKKLTPNRPTQLHLRMVPPPPKSQVTTSPGLELGRGERHSECRSYAACLSTFAREHLVGTGHADPQGRCPKGCIGYSETEPWRFLALAAHHARGAGAVEPAAYDD